MLTTLLICSFATLTAQVYSPEFLAKIPSVDYSIPDATKKDVIYYLFKDAKQTTAITLNEDYVLTEEEKKLPVKILMHGYTSNVTSPWFKEMKRAYFQKGPHIIIYIDWSVAANKSFAVSAANIKPMGEYIADAILKLGAPPENVHLIGHSLGSHLAGFIGKNVYSRTGQKISRISATDAAGPGFEKTGPESRLSTHDANFVDVYHTDAGYYGIIKPIGHVDFYINGGKFQPGCPSRNADDNCSHARSNYYFIESINATDVTAIKAKLEETGEGVPCDDLDEVLFGDPVPPSTRGLYYIETEKTPPYLIRRKFKQI